MKIPKIRSHYLPIWALGLGLVCLVWAHWSGFVLLAAAWEQKPEYSHGYLVPLFALVLLWFRHEMLEMGEPRHEMPAIALLAAGIIGFFLLPASFLESWGFLLAAMAIIGAGWLLRPENFEPEECRPTWWGLPLLLIGVGLHLFAGYFFVEWFDHLSMIPTIAGIVLLTVGWSFFRWSWPAILFVGFMIPLPHTLEGLLRSPLRLVGTKASTYIMQTCGLPAFADGNRHEIVVGGMTHRIGVTEACSGLSMLMIFFALSTAVAILIKRPIWEKLFVFLSAVPIALIANVLRITATGIMLYALEDYELYLGIGGMQLLDMTGTEFANSFFHDWAGWLMMPIALVLLWLELAILRRIVVIEDDVPVSASLTARRSEDLQRDNNKHAPQKSAQGAKTETPAAIGS